MPRNPLEIQQSHNEGDPVSWDAARYDSQCSYVWKYGKDLVNLLALLAEPANDFETPTGGIY